MKAVNCNSNTTIGDLIDAGFKDGDPILIQTSAGARYEGTLVGGRVRGYQPQTVAESFRHATEIMVWTAAKGKVRFLLRQMSRISVVETTDVATPDGDTIADALDRALLSSGVARLRSDERWASVAYGIDRYTDSVTVRLSPEAAQALIGILAEQSN